MWQKMFVTRAPFWIQAVGIALGIFISQAFYHRLAPPQPLWVDFLVYAAIGGFMTLIMNLMLVIWPNLVPPERRHDER
jgi:hypothetical protein